MIVWIRRRVSSANVIAVIALCMALGGVSYAAVSLPLGSVGTQQIKHHAVTGPKLASKSVHRRALGPRLRTRLNAGVGRIHFSARASPSPAHKTALNFDGLRLAAACKQSGSTTSVTTFARSDHDAVLQDHFDVDTGTDPHTPGALTSGNLELDLQGGVGKALGGPGADDPDYARVIAAVIYTSRRRAMTLSVVEVVDASAGTCSLDGTAIPAT